MGSVSYRQFLGSPTFTKKLNDTVKGVSNSSVISKSSVSVTVLKKRTGRVSE